MLTWKQSMTEFVASEFKPSLNHWKMPSNDAGWRRRLYGLKNSKTVTGTEEEFSEGRFLQPELQVVARIDSHTAFMLLKYHLNWMRDDSLKESEGLWLFVLLLRLDPLLTSDQVSILRDLCRKCKKIRSILCTTKENKEGETEDPLMPRTSGKSLAALNMVIAVIAEVFGQRDLQDPLRL
jgi:hypothetical protein